MTDVSIASGPEAEYRAALDEGVIVPDPAQARAVAALQQRYRRLLERWEKKQSLAVRLKRALGVEPAPRMQGLYFWGGVGRGKTFLMDLFFHSLPGDRKLRMHFHRFMLMIHARLRDEQGASDPLKLVARGIARHSDVLCFDEFSVADIADAMILANLLDALFSEGVMLIATSNIVPDKLYERGLQRQKFMPAIDLIKEHTQVMNLDGGIDYRLQSMNKAPVYRFPLDEQSNRALDLLFQDLTRGLHVEEVKLLEVAGRGFVALRWAEGIAWFDFATLCRGPRGAADYIELARQYHTVFIAGVPLFRDDSTDDEARRFITLVDEFYDHGVKLVVSAEGPPEALYQGRELGFAFERTASRLLQMQTEEYLAAPHRPD